MRVIAGELKGQRLVAPRGWKVRPTSDRVREAIFSALGEVGGARVLDLYCGTGALAIEALSRGAAGAVLVDRDTRPALGNVERLGLGERAELVRSDVRRWLAGRAEDPEAPRFDLVFVDAPYRLADRVGQELETHLPRLLAEGGRAIVESGARRPLRLDSLEPLRQRRYGAADVAFYRERVADDRARRNRRLPGQLRPGHQRAPRHHHPHLRRSSSGSSSASSTTRSARRRRSSPPRSGRAFIEEATAGLRQRRGPDLLQPAGRVRARTGRQGDRQGAAGDLRLRVRVRDGAAQPQARPRDREHLHDRLARTTASSPRPG